MPSSRKRSGERKRDTGSATPPPSGPPQTLPAPAEMQANRKRARKRRPKFVL